MTEPEEVDVLIIGAGWHGLAMAKTYLEVTKAKVVIVDYAESIGGTWADERLYPGLKTNNVVGSYEFSDYPMDPDRYGLEPGGHIPGKVVHRYLSDFADHYDLACRIRLRTKAHAASLGEDGKWLVQYTVALPSSSADSSDNDDHPPIRTGRFHAAKLVLATGLTSEPFIPQFAGQEKFKGHIFHSKQLKPRADVLENTQSVVVIGGNKSAWDVSYTAARAGTLVHMVMRPSGGGPSWVWSPIDLGFFKTSLSRLSLTRAATWFDPSPFGNVGSAARRFIHGTPMGRWLCSWFWHILDRCVINANGYEDNFFLGMLRPWTSTFWMGNSLSIHNYDTDWFGFVRAEQIIPYIADVVSLSENSVRLSNGSVLEADAIVTCTGWKSTPTLRFAPEWVDDELRLDSWTRRQTPPCDPKNSFSRDDAPTPKYDALRDIREKILNQRPVLRESPVRTLPVPTSPHPAQTTGDKIREAASPIRLYRFMVPASERFLHLRNLAFIGAHTSIHATMLAQAQALWITAFFEDKLAPTRKPNPQAMVYDTLWHTEYERIRRPREAGGQGDRAPDLVFDSLPYLDMLFEDLGLRTRRKGSWMGELMRAYTLGDYRGIVREWSEMREGS